MVIRMGTASLDDLPQLRALWREAFGDSEAYMDLYFNHRFEPNETYILREDGEIVSMMTAMRVFLWAAEENTLPGRYIYAVATKKRCQGKGYSHRLDRFMAEALRKEGCCFTCLVPAEDSLRRFYRTQGYRETFPHYVGMVQRSHTDLPTDLQPCPFSLFWAMRTQFLKRMAPKKAALYHPEPELSYVYQELHACDGLTVTFLENGIWRFAVLDLPEGQNTLVLRETDGDVLYAANVLLHFFNRQEAQIHSPFPFAGGEAIPYGMGRRLDKAAALPEGYMALMLD